MDGQIATDLLNQIKMGAANWKMPWYKGMEMPVNAVTHAPYKGRNADTLWWQCLKNGYRYNRWATLKQWAKAGARVRLGQKGTPIFTPRKGMAPDMFTGESEALQGFYRTYVFNEAQVNNFDASHPDLFNLEKQLEPQYELLNALIVKSGADIFFSGEKAYYSPNQDLIRMPENYRFFDPELRSPNTGSGSSSFYATLLHELIHWTKHKNRCGRPGIGSDIRTRYAFEELIAEIGAVLICEAFNQVPVARKQNAAYLAVWLKALENDESLYFEAVKYAHAAAEWLYDKTGVYPPSWNVKESENTSNKPKNAINVRVMSPQRVGFKTSQRIEVTCAHCEIDYELTVTRYEEHSVCPECLRVNLHALCWN